MYCSFQDFTPNIYRFGFSFCTALEVPPEQTDIMDIMDQNDLMELDAAWWLDALNMWRF